MTDVDDIRALQVWQTETVNNLNQVSNGKHYRHKPSLILVFPAHYGRIGYVYAVWFRVLGSWRRPVKKCREHFDQECTRLL